METITTRPATIADIPALLQFEQGVITAERPYDDMLKPDPLHYYNLQELIAAPHILLVVAELGGQAIGSGYARIETSKHFLSHPQHCYLGFMYVLPQHRGKGVNNLVMQALKDWTVSQGINELQLEVYYGNSPAVKAYEKSGFIKNMIQMRMGL
jgi:ribosomal protein S18 acetylase RimI-like enzyme